MGALVCHLSKCCWVMPDERRGVRQRRLRDQLCPRESRLVLSRFRDTIFRVEGGGKRGVLPPCVARVTLCVFVIGSWQLLWRLS
jgi:hypothetical protein